MSNLTVNRVRDSELGFRPSHQVILDILDGDHRYLERWLRLKKQMRNIIELPNTMSPTHATSAVRDAGSSSTNLTSGQEMSRISKHLTLF